MKAPTVRQLAIVPLDTAGATGVLGCGVCHRILAPPLRPAAPPAVVLGVPSFQAPALHVCRPCLVAAIAVIDVDERLKAAFAQPRRRRRP